MQAASARASTTVPAEFRGLQVLRGLAALMVVTFHATRLWSEHVSGSAETFCWQNGAAGVDIFFVISGVVMALSTRSDRGVQHPGRQFFERRLVRVFPLYWIMTALFLLKQLLVAWKPALQGSVQHVQLTPGFLLASVFLVPYRDSLGVVQPLLAVGWTLSFELFFYLVFAIALARRIVPIRLVTPVMVILAGLSLFRSDSWPTLTVLASPLLLEFLVGMWLGWMLQNAVAISSRWAIFSVGTGLAAMLLIPPPAHDRLRALVWGVPAALLVMGTLYLEQRWAKYAPQWSLLLGDSSYSLYLSHLLLFSIMGKLMLKTGLLNVGLTSRWIESTVVLVVVSMAVLGSLVVYRWVERPVNEALRKRLKLRHVQMMTVR